MAEANPPPAGPPTDPPSAPASTSAAAQALPSDRLPAGILGLLTRAGVQRADVDTMLESWRWRATWGAAVGAMAGSAAMRVFVYAHETRGPGYHLSESSRWVILIVFMVLGGMLGDLYGRRRLLIACLAGMTVVSVLAALGGSMVVTGFGLRLLIGVLGAMVLPLTLAVVRTALQPRVLGVGVLVYMSGYAVGFLLPHLGTLLARWLGPGFEFTPMILAAAVGLDAVSAYAPLDRPIRVRQSDLVAIALLVLAVGGIALGVQHAAADETSLGVSIGLVLAGLLALAVFSWWQARQPSPVLDPRRLRERWFLSALLSGAVVAFGLQLSWRAVILMILVLLGSITLKDIGILTLVALVGAGAGAGASALLSARMNGGHLMALGIGAMGLGLLGVAGLFLMTANILWLAIPIAMVAGGIVLGTMMRTLVIVAGVPARSAGTASGLLNAVGFLGGLLAPLIFLPVISLVSLTALQRNLTALGLPAAQVAKATASLQSALGSLVAVVMGELPQEAKVELASQLQRALQAGLEVLLLGTGLAVALAAIWVWRSWNGRDTPLYDPATGGPAVFDDLGEQPE